MTIGLRDNFNLLLWSNELLGSTVYLGLKIKILLIEEFAHLDNLSIIDFFYILVLYIVLNLTPSLKRLSLALNKVGCD